MVKVQCIKCNREGSLTTKHTKSKGITYRYWYIEHHIGKKIKWCYLGKYKKLPEDYKKLIHKDTQTDTQTTSKSENLNLSLKSKKKNRAGSLVWIGHEQPVVGVSLLSSGSRVQIPSRPPHCIFSQSWFFAGLTFPRFLERVFSSQPFFVLCSSCPAKPLYLL